MPFPEAILTSGTITYIGGDFTTIQSQPRSNFAAINHSSGVFLPLDLRFNGSVQSLLLNGSTLYVGGSFTSTGNFFSTSGFMINRSGVIYPSTPSFSGGMVDTAIPDGSNG